MLNPRFLASLIRWIAVLFTMMRKLQQRTRLGHFEFAFFKRRCEYVVRYIVLKLRKKLG